MSFEEAKEEQSPRRKEFAVDRAQVQRNAAVVGGEGGVGREDANHDKPEEVARSTIPMDNYRRAI